MTLDPNALLLSLVVSSVGFVFFSYGKRQGRAPQMIAGVILMIYPYFVSSLIAGSLIAAAVVGLLWVAVRAGA